MLQIECGEVKIESVEVFDMMGRHLNVKSHLESETWNKMNLDISHLPSGVYFIKLLSGNQLIKTTKIIKL